MADPTQSLAQQINALYPQLMSQYGGAMLGGYIPGGTPQGMASFLQSPQFNTYNPGQTSGYTPPQVPQRPPQEPQGQGQAQGQGQMNPQMMALMQALQGQGGSRTGMAGHYAGQGGGGMQPPQAGGGGGMPMGGQMNPQWMQALMAAFAPGAGGLGGMNRVGTMPQGATRPGAV